MGHSVHILHFLGVPETPDMVDRLLMQDTTKDVLACNTDHEDGAPNTHCGKCGSPVSGHYCSNCGTKKGEKGGHCRKCGDKTVRRTMPTRVQKYRDAVYGPNWVMADYSGGAGVYVGVTLRTSSPTENAGEAFEVPTPSAGQTAQVQTLLHLLGITETPKLYCILSYQG